MSYCIDDGAVELWTPGESFPDELRAEDLDFYAHNAPFELAIWNIIMAPRYNWPALPVERVFCTMAMAYAMGLPGALEKAGAALGLEIQKDMKGHRLMLQMAAPRKEHDDGRIEWWDTPDRLARLYAYCVTDTETERALLQRLVPLSASERRIWLMDYAINQRGVYVDRETVLTAIKIAESEQERLSGKLFVVTSGAVSYPSEVTKLTAWINAMGVETKRLRKTDVIDLLAEGFLPDGVRTALEIRQAAGKTSVSKLSPMIGAASADGRLRGMFQYHGAQPGRWAGRRVQLHNMPRPKMPNSVINEIIGLMEMGVGDAKALADTIGTVYGEPLIVLSDTLRGMLTAAPGNELIAVDFSNIEGRGIAWEAGEEWKLDAFRAQDAKTGPEIYLIAAGKIYNQPADNFNKKSPERQIGKVSELACGYQGGVAAFQKMAVTYGVKVPDAQADQIKTAWRAGHPAIVNYWRDLENAAINAVLNEGAVFAAGPLARQIKFRKAGSFLWMQLPSKRVLCYPYPKIEAKMTPWGELKDSLTYMSENGLTRKWERDATYGGSLSQNVTEGVCRDILATSMLRVEEELGYPVVMHVHDELVVEVPQSTPPDALSRIEQIMKTPPAWAAGFPIEVEGWRAKRYRK